MEEEQTNLSEPVAITGLYLTVTSSETEQVPNETVHVNVLSPDSKFDTLLKTEVELSTVAVVPFEVHTPVP